MKEIQIHRNDIQFFGTKSKPRGTNSKSGGTKSKFKILQFPSRNPAFLIAYADLTALRPWNAAAGSALVFARGCSSVLFVFVSGSSGLFKRVKGWRRFHDRGRLDAISARPRTPAEQLNRLFGLGAWVVWLGGGFRGLSEGGMSGSMIDTQAICRRWNDVGSKLDERRRRLFAAGEVRAAGRGGLEAVAKITGYRALDARAWLEATRWRAVSGGPRSSAWRRSPLSGEPRRDADRGFAAHRGTCDARRSGASAALGFEEPRQAGRHVARDGPQDQRRQHEAVAADAWLQSADQRKADEGSNILIAMLSSSTSTLSVVERQAAGQPVISVDTKKKELVGNYKNGGSDYRPKGDPQRVKAHDFEDKELGKVVPYGVYDERPISASSVSASMPIRPSSRSQPSVAGSTRWGASATRTPAS